MRVRRHLAGGRSRHHVAGVQQRDPEGRRPPPVGVGEGPCLDAITEEDVFRTGDLTTEDRWPQFSTRAHDETGITSILSVRLFIEEDTLGALNLYSTEEDAFDDTDVSLASVFAVHAAVAMSSAKREHDLEAKADTRDLIGRAKGILMAREHVTDERAFDLLRQASQRLNVKVVDIADEVTHTGTIPES
ncbi:MAG TPA: GAF and ANTAR domain-containing protein [Aquihabitans sp.]|nr:GAF and ANTAR domain-containing protein [Aquihabitans sp.]